MTETWLEPDVLTIYFLGLGGTVLGLIGLLTSAQQKRRPIVLAIAGLVLLLALFSGTAACCRQPAGIWLPPLVLAGIVTLFQLSRFAWMGQACSRAASLVRNPYLQWGFLLVGSPVFAFTWAMRTEQLAGPVEVDFSFMTVEEPPTLDEVFTPYVLTDRGRPIPIYRNLSQSVLPTGLLEKEQAILGNPALSLRLIRTAQADPDYNCHGWVFADGQFWIKGRDVVTILEDNGYRAVSTPLARDLVVHRNLEGVIIHTGLVQAVSANGLVLIESKWGRLGRFLHSPKDHVYSGDCTFYRSARRGHQLKGIEQPAQKAAQVSRTWQPRANCRGGNDSCQLPERRRLIVLYRCNSTTSLSWST